VTQGRTRRAFTAALAATLVASAAPAHAQFGGRQRGGGGERTRASSPDNPRAARPSTDPAEAMARELPSLRVDLKLTPEQVVPFDAFDRDVRELAGVARDHARHVEGFRHDDGSTLPAVQVFQTLSDDDAARADASHRAGEGLQSLYDALDADQRKQLDRRLREALRDPLAPG